MMKACRHIMVQEAVTAFLASPTNKQLWRCIALLRVYWENHSQELKG